MTQEGCKGYYNGFGPNERKGALASVRAAIAAGTVPMPTRCSVCGVCPDYDLGFHGEDYRRPLAAYPICRGCHVRLHARFRHPDRWRDYISRFDPDGWFQRLSLDPRSLRQPYDQTYPELLKFCQAGGLDKGLQSRDSTGCNGTPTSGDPRLSNHDEESGQSSFRVTQEENPILWALQQYQKVTRLWVGSLSAIEYTVLMQILDRTVGWQRESQDLTIRGLLEGGRHYRGIGNAVRKASLMKALRSLEDRGIIRRRPSLHFGRVRNYVINLDWTPPARSSPSDMIYDDDYEGDTSFDLSETNY